MSFSGIPVCANVYVCISMCVLCFFFFLALFLVWLLCPIPIYFVSLYSILLFSRLSVCFLRRDRKDMDPDRGRDGKELGWGKGEGKLKSYYSV